jgi:hypothetical protein
MTLLSKVLEDEHFRALVETYGCELAMRTMNSKPSYVNTSGYGNRSDHHTDFYRNENGNNRGRDGDPMTSPQRSNGANDEDAKYLSGLQDRLSTLEMQHEFQQAMFQELRNRVRPLAQALGCCPECLVGVIGCQRCGGKSGVGTYAPDESLLEEHVIQPLAARGLQLRLRGSKTAAKDRQSSEPTAKAKEI